MPLERNIGDSFQSKLGEIGEHIVSAFSLNIDPHTPVYIGSQNIQHIKAKHSDDYLAYGGYMESILKSPDFVGINSKDNSLEYYKQLGENVVHVKLAVRSTSNGVYFARTMYSMKATALQNRIDKGTVVEVIAR